MCERALESFPTLVYFGNPNRETLFIICLLKFSNTKGRNYAN